MCILKQEKHKNEGGLWVREGGMWNYTKSGDIGNESQVHDND